MQGTWVQSLAGEPRSSMPRSMAKKKINWSTSIQQNITHHFLKMSRQWHPTPVLLPWKSHGRRSWVGCSPWGREESDTTSLSLLLFHFHALEKEMATHSSVPAWRIPGTGEPGGLLSMGSHRVGDDWSDLAAAAATTPVLLPGKSHGWRSLVGCGPWGREESDTTERLHFYFFTFTHWRRKWQPTPVFLPRESQGRGSLVGWHLWGHTQLDTTEAT